MNATLALLTYGFVAVALVAAGIYALNRGFKLILSGRGRSKEESSVELLGFKAAVGSLGALVMVTSFLWGFAAVYALPKYKDPNVTVAFLEKDKMIESLTAELGTTRSELTHARSAVASIRDLQQALNAQQGELAKWQAAIKTSRMTEAAAHAENAQAKIAEVQRKVHDLF
ncbi:MAG: hypothetical protein ABSD47_17485 [Candidatus Methylomirabilota bacterium]|jgi:hypothetical protein